METRPRHVIRPTRLFAGFDRLQTENGYRSAGAQGILTVQGWGECQGQKFHFAIAENPLSLFPREPHARQRSKRFLRRLHVPLVVTICLMYRDELIRHHAAIGRESRKNR